MLHSYIAYIRVSTARQGIEGVSLDEQRRAITVWQNLHQATIEAWYVEIKTAGKRGRPVFDQVLRHLKRGQGKLGLIMHKIDRGARNLRDWADIGELIDQGIEVHFTHDDIDLHTRGGRLAADIQAVIAADYIRNLRDEVKKGIVGRLHQGLYPFKAPIGYRNTGRGRAKVPDPIRAPLIVAAFRRYASGTFTYATLADDLARLGLTQACGQPLRTSTIGKILHNRFYLGECVVRGVVYPGVHQPLVSQELFAAVQSVAKQRRRKFRQHHAFRYRRALICQRCQHCLVGELHKGNVYYRCHYCSGISVREDRVPECLADPNTAIRVSENADFSLIPFEKFDSP